MISFTFFIKIDLMLYIPGPGAHVASCMLGTGSLSWGWSGQGIALTNHHHLALRLKSEESYTTIPSLDHYDP